MTFSVPYRSMYTCNLSSFISLAPFVIKSNKKDKAQTTRGSAIFLLRGANRRFLRCNAHGLGFVTVSHQSMFGLSVASRLIFLLID